MHMRMRTTVNVQMCLVLACLAAFSLIAVRTAGTPADADVAIVLNPDTPVNNLTLADLRQIYLGERQDWRASSPVVVLMRPGGPRDPEAILRVVSQTPAQRAT